MTAHIAGKTIDSIACTVCMLCGADGEALYGSLSDRLFSASGSWNLRRCPNRACSLIWLDPMPTELDIEKAYAEYYTHKKTDAAGQGSLRTLYGFIRAGYFAHMYHHDRNSTRSWVRWLGSLIYLHPLQKAALDLNAMYLRPKPHASLLDVGCGSGKRMQLLRDLGWSVEGVDNDLQAIGQAQNKGLNVRLGNLDEQEYSDNRFDAITMSHVIEHVHQPLSLLQECHRILKPGGKLALVTPNAESWGHRLFKDAWVHLDPPRHFHLYTTRTLRKLVGKAYFGNVETFTTLHWHDITFQGSKSVGQTGRYIIDSSQSWTTNIWARSMEFLEYAILQVRPHLGEELVLISEKG